MSRRREQGRHPTKTPIFICAINGSSRFNGETARKLNQILRDAEKEGARTELIHLAKRPLRFCDGNQEPMMRHDLKKIIDTLKRADGIIFGTPTYWYNMSGLMKKFLDRLTITEKDWMLDYKVAGFIVTGSKHEGWCNDGDNCNGGSTKSLGHGHLSILDAVFSGA